MPLLCSASVNCDGSGPLEQARNREVAPGGGLFLADLLWREAGRYPPIVSRVERVYNRRQGRTDD